MSSTFGQRIRTARLAQSMSQEALATLVVTSRQAISQYEADNACPSWVMGCRLAHALGIPLTELDVEATK